MLKWVAAGLAAILLLGVVAILALPSIVDTARVQSAIANAAAGALGRRIAFSSVSLRVLPLPAVLLRGLEVADDPRFSGTPFLTVDTASFRLRLMPLLSGRLEFSELVLDKPQVAVIQDAAGRLNIATLGASRETSPPRPTRAPAGVAAAVPIVSAIDIRDGVIRYAAGGGASYTVGDMDLEIRGAGPGSPLRFSGAARLDAGDVRLKITDGTVGDLGTRALMDAPLAARIAVDGRDLRNLTSRVMGASPEIGGAFSGVVSLGGTLGTPTITGDLTFPKITVTETRPTCANPQRRTLTIDDLRMPLALTRDAIAIKPMKTRMHGGELTATVIVDLGERLNTRLRDTTVRALPLGPILVDYWCQGYAVTGVLELWGDYATRPGAILTALSGEGRLKIGSGKVVGPQALATLGQIARRADTVLAAVGGEAIGAAPLEFDSITASYVITNGTARTRDFLYVSRLMRLAASGEYGLADGKLNLDVAVSAGRTQVQAKVTGTAASPSIRLNPASLLTDPTVQQGVRSLIERLR